MDHRMICSTQCFWTGAELEQVERRTVAPVVPPKGGNQLEQITGLNGTGAVLSSMTQVVGGGGVIS